MSVRLSPVTSHPMSLEALIGSEAQKSSLSPASESLSDGSSLIHESYKPSMPMLAPPTRNAQQNPGQLSYNETIVAIIATLEKIHAAGKSINLNQSNHFENVQKNVAELQKQELEKMQEAAKKAQQSSVWGFLQTIGAYILAAIHAVLGVFLISEAHILVGGTMLASALIAVANLAFTQTGFWTWLSNYMAKENEELASKLSAIIPGVIGLTAAALGFIGTCEIWNMQNLDWAKYALLIGKTTLDFAQGVSSVAKGVSDYQLGQSHSEHVLIEKDIELCGHVSEKLMKDMEQMMKTLTQCTSKTAQIVKMSIDASQKALQV